MKIYLAHPISGLSYEDVMGYYRAASSALRKAGYEVLCPMQGKDYLRTETALRAEGYQNPISTNQAIVRRDHWMVEQADLVYVNLAGSSKVSIGSLFELAWAYHLRKHVVLVMDPAGGPSGDLYRHAFVLECADILFETHEEAMAYLVKLARN